MRAAIIADIHGNLEAFETVLADIERKGGVDEFWCLGDTVGYGPDPRRCMEIIRQLKPRGVAGNHDLAVCGCMEISSFNQDAAAACRWSAAQLSKKDLAYLKELPLTIEVGDFTLAHGSPREPVWEYIIAISVGLSNFSFFSTKYCIVGHSHTPLVFKKDGEECVSSRLQPDIGLVLGENKLIINPGSIGQPRDGDPRASYAIYDSDAAILKLYRLEYDFDQTIFKMLHAGLPLRLATRLKVGV